MTRPVAEVMVYVLIGAGARRSYGVPVDTLDYFTDAVRSPTLRWVHVRHEGAGAMVAGAVRTLPIAALDDLECWASWIADSCRRMHVYV
jgi:hypothetical protein